MSFYIAVEPVNKDTPPEYFTPDDIDNVVTEHGDDIAANIEGVDDVSD